MAPGMPGAPPPFGGYPAEGMPPGEHGSTGSAYISDRPPGRTAHGSQIPTEAPAYILGTACRGSTNRTEPILSSLPGSQQVSADASRRQHAGYYGAPPGTLPGAYPPPAMPPPYGGKGGSGRGGCKQRPDITTQHAQQGLGETHNVPAGAWVMPGALEAASSAGAPRNDGGKGKKQAASSIATEKNRQPLSGGGPKRTDYLKKYGAGQAAEQTDTACGSSSVPITTMMLKNIPCRKSQEEVMQHMDQNGFSNRYDFFYLPKDVKFRANLGYAFINFLTPDDASAFAQTMGGYRFNGSGSTKECVIVPAHVQGLVNNLAAFKRTEVMRSSRKPFFSGATTL